MDGVFEIELNNHASQMFKEGGSVTFEVVETREGEELPLQYIDVYTHNGNEEWYLCDGGTSQQCGRGNNDIGTTIALHI